MLLTTSQTRWPLKVTGAIAPLTVLVNGVPAQARPREHCSSAGGPGFARVTVIDGSGAADSVLVRMEDSAAATVTRAGLAQLRRAAVLDGSFPAVGVFINVAPVFTAGSSMGASNGTASLAAGPVPGLVGVFDFAASSHRRAISVLVLLSLLAFLPGFFAIPPVDRDEAEYAQVTKQMMESRDYVDVRLRDDVYYQKPVGIYWLQAAAVRSAEALGTANARTTIWVYRLPSLIGAIGAVLATYWCALAFVSRRGATLAALLMAGSVLLGVEARLATIDSMLLLATVAAMGVLARTYLWSHDGEIERPGWGLLAVLWTALAVGVLLKGVVILMVVTLAAATLCVIDRSVRWLFALRPLPASPGLSCLRRPGS